MTRAAFPAAAQAGAILRFAAVGLAATASYLAATLALGRLGLAPGVANLAGVALSLLVSYLGHHRVTFRRDGGHARYGPRFVAVAALLAAASTAWTWWTTAALGWSPEAAALGVAIGYPALSYLFNAGWAFRRPAAASAQGAAQGLRR